MREANCEIKFRVDPTQIAFLVQIMEGYSHIGVVTTTDPQNGEILLLVTPDTYAAAQEILASLPLL